MLDIKFVRSNPDAVVAGMKKRGMDLDLAPFLEIGRASCRERVWLKV